jgi:hypothetical protein
MKSRPAFDHSSSLFPSIYPNQTKPFSKSFSPFIPEKCQKNQAEKKQKTQASRERIE